MSDHLNRLKELERIRQDLNLSETEFQFLKENFVQKDDRPHGGPPTQGVPLGDHILVERLGEGPWGKCYKAEDPQGRFVVLKVLRPELMVEPHLSRFRAHANTLVDVDHPNLADHLSVMNSPALAMVIEYLDGAPFSANDEPVPVEAVEYIVQEMLNALVEIHAAGSCHGDIKPSNVILCRDGVVKVMDTGFAWVMNDDHAMRNGTWKGSLSHMAPECFAGSPSPASDVYSIGLIAWELLAGYPACPHNNLDSQRRWHEQQGPMDIAHVQPDCPQWMAQSIMTMIQPDIASRPENAQAALALWIADDDPPLREFLVDNEQRDYAPDYQPSSKAPLTTDDLPFEDPTIIQPNQGYQPNALVRRQTPSAQQKPNPSVSSKTRKSKTVRRRVKKPGVFEQLTAGFKQRLQAGYVENCQVEYLGAKKMESNKFLKQRDFRVSNVSCLLEWGDQQGVIVINHGLLSAIFSLSVWEDPEFEQNQERVTKLSRTIQMIAKRLFTGFGDDLERVASINGLSISPPSLKAPKLTSGLKYGRIRVGPSHSPYGMVAIGLPERLWKTKALRRAQGDANATSLGEFVEEIPVRLTAQVSTFQVPFQSLQGLKVGSYVPLPENWASGIVVLVNGKSAYAGEYGEYEGMRAIRLASGLKEKEE